MEQYLNEPTYEQYPREILNIEFLKNKFLHIIIPANAQGKQKFNPLIIFLTNDDDHLHMAPLFNIASQGFTIGVIPHQQLTGDLRHRTAEVKSGIRYMLLHAYKYSIDTNRYFIWGEQSGAELALTCITTANQQDWNFEDSRIMPLHFKGGIIFGLESLVELSVKIPTYDLPTIAFFSGIDDFTFSKDENEQLIKRFADAGHAVQNYLLKGTADGTDAFYTPYMQTLVENFIRGLL